MTKLAEKRPIGIYIFEKQDLENVGSQNISLPKKRIALSTNEQIGYIPLADKSGDGHSGKFFNFDEDTYEVAKPLITGFAVEGFAEYHNDLFGCSDGVMYSLDGDRWRGNSDYPGEGEDLYNFEAEDQLLCFNSDPNHVYRYSGDAWELTYFENGNPFETYWYPRNVIEHGGCIYVDAADSYNMYIYNGVDWRIYTLKEYDESYEEWLKVYWRNKPGIMEVYNGELFIATQDSAVIYKWIGEGKVERTGFNEFVGHNYNVGFLKSFDGSLWASTGGLLYEYNGSWSYVKALDSLPYHDTSFVQDGCLYCYGYEAVYGFDGVTWEKIWDVDLDMLVGYDGKLYANTTYGEEIYVYDGGTWSVCTETNSRVFNGQCKGFVFDDKLYVSDLVDNSIWVNKHGVWTKKHIKLTSDTWLFLEDVLDQGQGVGI